MPGPKSFIRTLDTMQITPDPTPPWVAPSLSAPIPLNGTGATVIVEGQPVCLVGDERLPPILTSPIPYTAPGFTVPGTVTLSTIVIQPNLTTTVMVAGKPAILKGTTFKAMFTVASPAVNESSGVPDPVAMKTATCQFVKSAVKTDAA